MNATATPKNQIRAFVERMPDDVTMDEMLYKLELFVEVYTGLQESERGEGIDHDDFMAELERQYGESKDSLATACETHSRGNRRLHRKGLAKKRPSVHKAVKNGRKKT